MSTLSTRHDQLTDMAVFASLSCSRYEHTLVHYSVIELCGSILSSIQHPP